jgi:hypothetical protein
MLGRFHLVRVLFGSAILVLCLIIFYQNFYKQLPISSGVIRLPAVTIHETWMTLEEFKNLAKPNTSCPVSL